MAENKSYITRGALLQCSCGTHGRKINLIHDHGWRIDVKDIEAENKKPHPFMLSCDKIVGDESMGRLEEQNISWFGVCSAGVKGSEEVILKPDNVLYPDKKANDVGQKCKPVFLGEWTNTKEDILVCSASGEGYPLTTASELICKYGGKVRIVEGSNGTEYDGSQDQQT